MKKYLSVLTFLLAGSGLAHASDNTINSAKAAVTKMLESRYKPNECAKWKSMESGGATPRGVAIAKCDNDFNPIYGLEFSSVETKKQNGVESVCGIVSGKTEISRIGGRFVYLPENGSVTFKASKYPMYSLASSGDLGKNQIKIENKQYQSVSDMYCQ